jgi:tetratricopeptide (TPR) repeat protein
VPPKSLNPLGEHRRPARSAVVFALIAFLSIGLASCGKQEKKKARAHPAIAVAAEAQGDVSVRPAGSDYWLACGGGTPVYDGDTIWIGPDSGGFFLVPEGCEIAVAQNSSLALFARKGELHSVGLARGEAWVEGAAERMPSFETPAVSVTADAKVQSASIGITVEAGGNTTVVAATGGARLENDAGKSTVLTGNKSTCAPGTAPGAPVMVGSESTTPTAMTFPFLVELQSDRYFRTKATREAAEDEARASISSTPNDAWPHINLGRAVLDAGNIAEAKKEFEQALVLDPQLSQAFAGLAKINLMEHRWKEAGEAYTSARRADPKSFEAVFGLGQAALGRGDLREAEKWYKETLKFDPEGTKPLVGLAIIDLLRLDVDGSMDNLRRASRSEPSNTRAYALMAIIYSLRKNIDQTETFLKKALRVDPYDYGTLNTLGLVYMTRGMNGEARDCFERMVDSEDTSVTSAGYQNLAAVDQLEGKLRRALDSWGDSHDLAPGVLQVLINIGQAQLLLGEPGEAVAAFSQVVSADPGNWLPHEWLSRAYLSAGSAQQAEAESRAALALNPSSWISHVVLGLSLEMMGDTQGARVELNEGRDMAADVVLSSSDHALLGQSHEKQGNLLKALKEYKAAAGLSPRDPGYQVLIGSVLRSLKRDNEALAQYRKVLEMNPSNSQARLNVAAILLSKGNLDGAIKELQRGVEKNPDDAALRKQLAEYLLQDKDIEGAVLQLDAAATTPGIKADLLGAVLVIRGNARDRQEEFAAAIEDYTQAVAADPSRGDAWYYMAGDLERVGRLPDAKNAYRNAVELCQGRPEWQKFYDEAAAKLRSYGI